MSDHGRIKSLSNSISRKEKILKQQIRNGYMSVELSRKGQKSKKFFVHRLVAIAFIPNPENKEQVNHLDACKFHNNLTNLQWTTRKENIAHAIALGLMNKNNNPVIATHLDSGERRKFKSQTEASRELGVYMKNISNALNGRITHVGRWAFERSSLDKKSS